MAVDTLLAPSVNRALASPSYEKLAVEPSMVVPDDQVIYRLSVEQYHAIARAGILDNDEPVELLEGLLVQKLTKNPPHTVATQLIQEALRAILSVGGVYPHRNRLPWRIVNQNPILL